MYPGLLHPRCRIRHLLFLNFIWLVIAQSSSLSTSPCKDFLSSKKSTAPPILIFSAHQFIFCNVIMLEQFSRGHDEASQGRGRRNALASKRKVKEEREKQRDRLHACSQQLDLDKLPLNFRLNHICSQRHQLSARAGRKWEETNKQLEGRKGIGSKTFSCWVVMNC